MNFIHISFLIFSTFFLYFFLSLLISSLISSISLLFSFFFFLGPHNWQQIDESATPTHSGTRYGLDTLNIKHEKEKYFFLCI